MGWVGSAGWVFLSRREVGWAELSNHRWCSWRLLAAAPSLGLSEQHVLLKEWPLGPERQLGSKNFRGKNSKVTSPLGGETRTGMTSFLFVDSELRASLELPEKNLKNLLHLTFWAVELNLLLSLKTLPPSSMMTSNSGPRFFRCFLALLPFDCLFDSFSILSMGPGEQGRGAYLLGQPSSSSSRSFVFSMFLMQRTDSFEKTLMLGKIEGGRRRGQQRMRLLDGITDSETGVRVSSRSWWWTGRPGVLRFMGSQRVRHNWVTELNWGFKKSITAKLLLFFVV